MKAKDTVMNPQRRAAIIHMINAKSLGSEHRVAKNIAEAQAEISFKAGVKEGQSDEGHNLAILLAVNAARKEGVKEVVDLMEDRIYLDCNCDRCREIQAKLKEWGIEK